MRPAISFVLCVVLTAAWSWPASAQDEPGMETGGGGSDAPAPGATGGGAGMPAVPSGGHGAPSLPGGQGKKQPAGFGGTVGGGMLFEKINEDYFVSFELYNETRIGPFAFGVQIPLRLRVWDRDPEDDGVIRGEDWDEVSDYARLVRFLELTLAGDTWRFRGRVGALEGESIGHGSILAGYYNSLDRDHYQAGLALSTAFRYGGFELMLDNILSPEIFGMRVHARPASFFSDNVYASRLVVGMSFVADTNAPLEATVNAHGSPVTDGENNHVFNHRELVSVLGLDVEYTVVQNAFIDLVPYMDINFMFDQSAGAGMHLGAFANFHLPWSIGPTLMTRLEYQAVGSGYAPRYFNSAYEAQRIQYSPARSFWVFHGLNLMALPVVPARVPKTKLGWLREGSSGAHGWLGELYFDFAGWVRVGGTYEDYQGPNNSTLTLSLLLPKLDRIKVAAYYSKSGFDSMGDAFEPDNALLLAFLRLKLWGPAYISATFTRTWHTREDGTYEVDDDFGVGAGVAFTY